MELNGLRTSTAEPWRVLEFYSGIGGMRYSLMKAAVNAVVVEAFDINDAANDVYEHNFFHRPYQGNIQSLSAADLDSYKANAWLLSPPCQPYTRQGLQKGSSDPRASSFLRILELISTTLQPPLMLFVENVVGFEASDTHGRMVQLLKENDFILQEFILSPLQFGIPYSRPRFFGYCLDYKEVKISHPEFPMTGESAIEHSAEDGCPWLWQENNFGILLLLVLLKNYFSITAKRKPLSFQNPQFNNKLFWSPGPLYGHDDMNIEGQLVEEYWDKLSENCRPIEDFLEYKNSVYGVDTEGNTMPLGFSEISGQSGERDDSGCSFLNQYFVPSSLVERWGSVMDVVFPDSKRCCCFTKSYYRFIKGTGSLLATIQGTSQGKTLPKGELRLRYFTPREVANLHSFPENFHFPPNTSLRQRYALLGNSLSAGVVAPLFSYLFSHSV